MSLLKDDETGHLVGIEAKPHVSGEATDFPKWKFRLIDEEGVQTVAGVIVSDTDEESALGGEWSDDRAEVVKGTLLEGQRIVEKHFELHQVVKPEPVIVEGSTDA